MGAQSLNILSEREIEIEEREGKLNVNLDGNPVVLGHGERIPGLLVVLNVGLEETLDLFVRGGELDQREASIIIVSIFI